MKQLSLVICVLLFIFNSVCAQKLDNVQRNSLFAPSGTKADGNIKEWKDRFEAYNKSTRIFYTLANDDKYLYLVMQSQISASTNKIMRGGITFSIKLNGGDNPVKAAITFPVVTMADTKALKDALRLPDPTNPEKLTAEQQAYRRDSIQAAMMNRRLVAFKFIKAIGIPGITDSVLSVYNEQGIKAVLKYTKDRNLNYELAIPLALLGLTAQNPEFNYQIRLNGERPIPIKTNISLPEGVNPSSLVTVYNAEAATLNGRAVSPLIADILDMINPTYLDGKYKLAVKM